MTGRQRELHRERSDISMSRFSDPTGALGPATLSIVGCDRGCCRRRARREPRAGRCRVRARARPTPARAQRPTRRRPRAACRRVRRRPDAAAADPGRLAAEPDAGPIAGPGARALGWRLRRHPDQPRPRHVRRPRGLARHRRPDRDRSRRRPAAGPATAPRSSATPQVVNVDDRTIRRLPGSTTRSTTGSPCSSTRSTDTSGCCSSSPSRAGDTDSIGFDRQVDLTFDRAVDASTVRGDPPGRARYAPADVQPGELAERRRRRRAALGDRHGSAATSARLGGPAATIAQDVGAVLVELGRTDPLHPLERGERRRPARPRSRRASRRRRRRRPASAPRGPARSATHGARRTAGRRRRPVGWRTRVVVGRSPRPEPDDRGAAAGSEPGQEAAARPASLATARLAAIGPRQVELPPGPGDPDVEQAPLLGERGVVVERLADRERPVLEHRQEHGVPFEALRPVVGQQVHAVAPPSRSWAARALELREHRATHRPRVGADDLVDDREDRLERGRSLAGLVAAGPSGVRPCRRARSPSSARKRVRIAVARATTASLGRGPADRAIAPLTSGRS